MTNDEIRTLLAGYATNTLSETERQALFEAALEDQELFDALNKEQPLKELLADPISRAQVRQALETPPPAPWWSGWWTWTAAASAIAAAVLMVAVTRSHAPEPSQQYASLPAAKPVTGQPAVQPAVQPADKLESGAKAVPQPAAQPKARVALDSERRQTVRARPSGSANVRKDEAQSIAAPVAPPAPAPPVLTTSQQVQVEAQSPSLSQVPSQSRGSDTQAQSQQGVGGAINSLRDQKQSQAVPAQFNGAAARALMSSVSPPVRYVLLKRDQDGTYHPLSSGTGLNPGDAVRLSVTPITSGYLTLSRQNVAGQWTRMFPNEGPGLSVSANASYTIPASPIDVTNADQTLRLTLVPASLLGVSATGELKAKAAPLKKESTPNPPLFVDLTIGPRSVR
jgi:Domain of unknown function (DUF4384)